MMVNLNLLFALALLSVIVTVVVVVLRPQRTRLVALGGTALLAFGWLVARSALPLTFVIGDEQSAWPAWTWQVGEFSWSVSLGVLLLALGALALQNSASEPEREYHTAFIHVLTFVTLLACWAGSLATYTLTWTLLNAVWLGGLTWTALSASPAVRQDRLAALPSLLGAGLAAILLLWLAAASAGPQSTMATAAEWSTLTQLLILLAAAVQLGVFPFHAWRFRDWDAPASSAALLYSAPAAAGGLLLARLESAGDVGLAFALPFTLMGLLALLAGARRAWLSGSIEASLPLALIQAQAGLVLLAGVWAGPQAVLAETSVLLLAGGILLLHQAGSRETASGRLPQLGPLIALAALAALPLTAGFTGRSAVYDAWLDQGHWLLILVTALLHVPLLLAALQALWPSLISTDHPDTNMASGWRTDDVPRQAALLAPALGLFSIAALSLAAPLSWAAILLPAAVAVVLAWRMDETDELRQILQEAFNLPLSVRPAWASFRRATGALSVATREALSILEGEGGMLWLLVFVVILYLVR
ncbi:MAG: proton-conducting transporter membrane subunit [Chloroflexota bacterium]